LVLADELREERGSKMNARGMRGDVSGYEGRERGKRRSVIKSTAEMG
jgi:hypothetical protein